MAELKELQDCELEILKSVTDVCDKYNLKYWLAFGTFLGAVRHQGFIPWDDDIDIYMTYKDIKKFSKIFDKELSEKFSLESRYVNPVSSRLYSKVRKKNTVVLERGQTYDPKSEQGVWIDIFPLMKFSSNNIIGDFQIKLLSVIRFCNDQYIAKEKQKSVKYYLKEIANKGLRLLEYITWETIDFLGIKGNRYLLIGVVTRENKPVDFIYTKCVYDRNVFKKRSKYDFDKYQFYGVENSKVLLTCLYGKDYMTPKRYNQHITEYENIKL